MPKPGTIERPDFSISRDLPLPLMLRDLEAQKAEKLRKAEARKSEEDKFKKSVIAAAQAHLDNPNSPFNTSLIVQLMKE